MIFVPNTVEVVVNLLVLFLVLVLLLLDLLGDVAIRAARACIAN